MVRSPNGIEQDDAGLLALFVDKAEAVDATVDRVGSADAVPDAVARYLRDLNMPAEAAIAPHADLDTMPWAGSTFALERRAARGSDRVSITRGFAGVAETGTLMMASGPDSPATLNFLPEVHVVVLAEGDIAGGYEDAWQRLRDAGRGMAKDFAAHGEPDHRDQPDRRYRADTPNRCPRPQTPAHRSGARQPLTPAGVAPPWSDEYSAR